MMWVVSYLFSHNKLLKLRDCKERDCTQDYKSDFHIGNIVKFGKYNNSKIAWQILDISEGKALLISCESILVKPYNENFMFITWKDCSLREWLNNEFYNSAFGRKEKDQIINSRIIESHNPKYSDITNYGKETNDKIFLLSVEEVNVYLKTSRERTCRLAQNTQNKSIYGEEDNCWWWLRTPGAGQAGACDIDDEGHINYDGDIVNTSYVCVRPAIWIDITPI